MSRAVGALGVGLVLLAACGSPPSLFSLQSVFPAQALTSEPVELHAYGAFPHGSKADLDHGVSTGAANYRLWLVTAGGRLELPRPVQDGGGELASELAAGVLAPGSYRLEIQDPWLRKVGLDRALTLTDAPDAAIPDAGASDAGGSDAGSPDAGSIDAGGADAGACSARCGAQSVCLGSGCEVARRVFLSHAAFLADFGGAAGADLACQNAAIAQALDGTWKAWVSDANTSPKTRFTFAQVPYRELDGTLVAATGKDLTRGLLGHGIDLDETGHLTPNTEVWTATQSDGTFAGDGCNGFTSRLAAGPPAAVGLSDRTDFNWSNTYLQFCDRTGLRLYCIEQ